MALIFPTPANPGDEYAADNGITYVYDGVKWVGNVPTQNPFDQNLNTTNTVSFVSITTPTLTNNNGVDITAGVDPSNTWTFRADGDLLVPHNVVNQGGHYYQDAADYGNTSIRWINVDTSGGQDIEMARVYAQGGNPIDGYSGFLDANERLQFGQRELGDNVSSFYILTTRNEIGLGVSESDDFRWEFQGNGNFVTPIGVGIGPGNYGDAIIGLTDPTSKNLVIGSETQGLGIGSDGQVVVQGRIDSEAPTVLAGSPGITDGVNGGDVLILGGYASGDNAIGGDVLVEAQNVNLEAVDNVVVVTNSGDYGWVYETDGGLTFPDLTTQYTAWQGAAIISDTAPGNDLGRLWFNSTDGRMYVKYNDNWVDTNPLIVPSPATYLDGLTIDGTTIGVVDTEAEQTVNIADNIRILGGKIYINNHEIGVSSSGEVTVNGAESVKVLDGGNASSWLLPI